MASHVLWVALITIVVIGLDYRSQTHLRFGPGFFKNHDLPKNSGLFFVRYGQVFRFSGLFFVWVGLFGTHFVREMETPSYLYVSLAAVLAGVILHQTEQGWMFLMKKKKKKG